MNTRLCCFVVPYFGMLPHTTPLFLKTCASNPEYNWLILTDDKTPMDYPCNVKVIYCSFSEFRDKIQSCFDFKIALGSPKKLCDFKPAYGYILSEELKDFAFWGYCDLDQCFGNLSRFISREVLEQYDKLFTLGHMTIYRNTPEINTLFMKESQYYGMTYREVFSNPDNRSFDEWPEQININILAEEAGIRINTDVDYVDVGPYRSDFVNALFDVHTRRWSIDSIGQLLITWDNGTMHTVWKSPEGYLRQRETMYVHLQKRTMNIPDNLSDVFLIYPDTVSCFGKAEQLTNQLLLYHLRRQKMRRTLHMEETKHRWKNFVNLWSHRFRKYILRKRK